MSASLYLLASEYREAAEKLAEYDLDEQTILDTLEGLSGDLQTKVINVAMFIRNLEVCSVAIKEAAKAQIARAKSMESRAENINEYLMNCMLLAGVQKIECPYFQVSIKKNPTSVVIDSESQIPDEFMRQPEPPPSEIDKKLIAEVLKAGVNVPWAHLDRKNRLEIR